VACARTNKLGRRARAAAAAAAPPASAARNRRRRLARSRLGLSFKGVRPLATRRTSNRHDRSTTTISAPQDSRCSPPPPPPPPNRKSKTSNQSLSPLPSPLLNHRHALGRRAAARGPVRPQWRDGDGRSGRRPRLGRIERGRVARRRGGEAVPGCCSLLPHRPSPARGPVARQQPHAPRRGRAARCVPGTDQSIERALAQVPRARAARVAATRARERKLRRAKIWEGLGWSRRRRRLPLPPRALSR
jgi:hypothetical protein